MEPRYDLLPSSKFDDEAVDKLALLPEAELRPLLPGLAEWIQDWNWPIAPAVGKLLEQHVAALVPTILEVLAGNDDVWQNNLLDLINRTTLPTLPAILRTAVERLAVFPAKAEYDIHLVWKARYVLSWYDAHPLLPRNKSDFEAVERLRLLPKAELLPLLPHLAEWLEDTNWPVSRLVGDLLLLHVVELEPFIEEVLLGYDDIWKCSLLRLVGHSALPALSPRMRELTERIACSPTIGERENDTAEAARDLLDCYATHLLPQHKGDDEAVQRLSQLPDAELLPLLPELLPHLLGCLLDDNWPIAKGINDLLAAHLHQLAPAAWGSELVEALIGADEIWKGHLLHLLNQAALSELPPAVRQVVERIAHRPTPGEREYDTYEAARDLLARYA